MMLCTFIIVIMNTYIILCRCLLQINNYNMALRESNEKQVLMPRSKLSQHMNIIYIIILIRGIIARKKGEPGNEAIVGYVHSQIL